MNLSQILAGAASAGVRKLELEIVRVEGDDHVVFTLAPAEDQPAAPKMYLQAFEGQTFIDKSVTPETG